jgi:hypothetical protein
MLMVIVDAHSRTGEVRDEFQGGGTVVDASDDDGPRLTALGFVARFGSALIQALGLAQERPLSHLAKIVAVIAAVGFLSLLRRRPTVAVLLGLPFAATLSASTLDIYPITERTTLFLVPCVALLLGEGIWWPARRWRGRTGLALAAAAAATAIAFPAYSAGYHVLHPRKKEELRALLEAVGTAWEPGDTLVLHPPTQYAFR